jgi:hypothetical protein
MPLGQPGGTVQLEMDARNVERAGARLRELRREEWDDVGLAALALGLAVAATEVRPAFAIPLLVGGLASTLLASRAFWRRWELLDRLVLEPDAYLIPEVRHRAVQAATTRRRQGLARSIRGLQETPRLALAKRIAAAAADLDALASELEDDMLELDPACAVACERLLTDGVSSPLLNPALPAEDVRSRVLQIRAGFERRDLRRAA